MLDASIFAYLGTILAAVAIAVVTQRLGTLDASGGFSRSARSCVVVGSGVLVLRGSDVSNYLSFLGVSHAAASTDTGVQTGSQRTMLLWMGWRMWRGPPAARDRLRALEHRLRALPRGREAPVPGPAGAGLPLDRRTRGACRTSASSSLADTGIVGFVLGLAMFGTGLVLGAPAGVQALVRRPVAVCWILVAAGTWNALGIVAGIPLDAVTWLGLGLAAVAASRSPGRRMRGKLDP